MADEISLDQVGRLAVVTGGAAFGRILRDKIASTNLDARYFTWTPHRPEEQTIPLTDMDECIRMFEEEGITHIIHAGQVSVHHFILAVMRGIVTGVNFAQLFMTAQSPVTDFFQPYDDKLDASGIARLSAADVFDTFAPRLGVMGSIQLGPTDCQTLPVLKLQALNLLARHQPFAGVAQSVVFDDLTDIGIETRRTDSLLRDIRRKQKPGRRVLMKVLPTAMPPKLDPPTIGPQTIVEAEASQVDIIALDAKNGVIVDREATVLAADRAGIALVGV